LIAQDPPRDGKRPESRVRFVIQKLYSKDRKDRVQTYYASSGRALGNGGPRRKKQDDRRFQIDFGLLHSGV
jgi:hypothetical protein